MIRTPQQIAIETVNRLASIHAEHLSGRHTCGIAEAAIRADRDQRRKHFSVQRIVEAWEVFDGDVDGFISAWDDYLAGMDEPCPATDHGVHDTTFGSCNECGAKNRN